MPKGVAVRVRAWAWHDTHEIDREGTSYTSSPFGRRRQRSSVVEHPIRNRAVVGSIPTAGSRYTKLLDKSFAVINRTRIRVRFCLAAHYGRTDPEDL